MWFWSLRVFVTKIWFIAWGTSNSVISRRISVKYCKKTRNLSVKKAVAVIDENSVFICDNYSGHIFFYFEIQNFTFKIKSVFLFVYLRSLTLFQLSVD